MFLALRSQEKLQSCRGWWDLGMGIVPTERQEKGKPQGIPGSASCPSCGVIWGWNLGFSCSNSSHTGAASQAELETLDKISQVCKYSREIPPGRKIQLKIGSKGLKAGGGIREGAQRDFPGI